VTEGEILVNGKARTKEFTYQASYVAQENMFLEIFSVRESLEFAANLTMPSSSTKREKEAKIDEVVKIMGLQSCENTMVGGGFYRGLSGGQMKRLGIAVTLLSGASILFLDEPTSKLDSAAAYNVVKTVQQLADQGKTIIYSIHQPSSEIYSMFNTLLILSQGRTVYYGAASDSVPYFSALGHDCPNFSNPADYFISLVNGDFKGNSDVSEFICGYDESEQKKAIEEIVTKEKEEAQPPESLGDNRAGFPTQLFWLLKRNAKNTALNPRVFRVRLGMYMGFSLLVSYLFSNDGRRAKDDTQIVSLFFMLLFFFGLQTMAALPFFLLLRPVFVRERSNGMYGVLPFHLANFIGTLPILLVCSSVATAIIWNIIGLYSHYFWFWLTTLCLLLVSESVMHVISALTSQFVIAVTFASAFILLNMLTAGYIVPFDDMMILFQVGYYSNYFSYVFKNFLFSEFHDHNGTDLLMSYEAVDVDRGAYCGVILGFAGGFQVIFFLLLFFIHTGKL